MRVTVIRENTAGVALAGESLLRFALSGEPAAGVVLGGLCDRLSRRGNTGRVLRFHAESSPLDDVICAIPEGWISGLKRSDANVVTYAGHLTLDSEVLDRARREEWFIVSNGRFATQVNSGLLEKVLAASRADVIAVSVKPRLMAYHEKVRLTSQGKLAGFRRLHCDSIEPGSIPGDWPHHVFINTGILDQVLSDRTLPGAFKALLQSCESMRLSLEAHNIAGLAVDLETETGLLRLCQARLSSPGRSHEGPASAEGGPSGADDSKGLISPDCRFVGPVLLGKDVQIGRKVVVVGPTILGDNARIEECAAVNSSIIGPGVVVAKNQAVQNRILRGPQFERGRSAAHPGGDSKPFRYLMSGLGRWQGKEVFRTWPRISYAGCFKRVADFLAALVVLILFAPFIPFVVLAIKLNSPGPIFFKDKRQGLRGKDFMCIKFRTMRVGAHKMQDKLRFVSEVDGPQFKMADDPRISAVGRFLRETYIDEIPQFFNVLIGQMSVVGPRPSPESENTQCPFWRDARLSVRPGITGLWQVCRTRRPMKDFQEWIHYDTNYVRELSLKTDLWVCWRTVRKMVGNFIGQF